MSLALILKIKLKNALFCNRISIYAMCLHNNYVHLYRSSVHVYHNMTIIVSHKFAAVT